MILGTITVCTMPLALAVLALSLSIWIVIPGPVLPLFVLTVGGTELWPFLAGFNAVVLLIALRSHSSQRLGAAIVALAALLCTLAPPIAYAARGPYVPLSALLTPLPEHAAIAVRPDAPVVLVIYGGAWEHGSPQSDALLNEIVASWGYRVIALDYPHAPRFALARAARRRSSSSRFPADLPCCSARALVGRTIVDHRRSPAAASH